MLYFSLLMSCNNSPLPCESNLQCWQTYGAGFTCNGVDSDTSSGQDESDSEDFHYCTTAPSSTCELWVEEDDYFYYKTSDFQVSDIDQKSKISDLITVIADPSEKEFEWNVFHDQLKDMQRDLATTTFGGTEFTPTPMNILFCEPDHFMSAIQDFGAQFVILTGTALQNYDMTSQFQILNSSNAGEYTNIFVPDLDKYGMILSQNATENEEQETSDTTILSTNLDALLPYSEDRVWYGLGSFDQNVNYLLNQADSFWSGADDAFSYNTSIFVHDIPLLDKITTQSIPNEWIHLYNETDIEMYTDSEFIVATYMEGLLEKLQEAGFDGQLIFDDLTSDEMDTLNTYFYGEGTSLNFDVYTMSDACAKDHKYKKQSLYLSYVVNSFLGLDNSKYTNEAIDESLLSYETTRILQQITSTSSEATAIPSEFGLGITSQTISDTKLFFSDKSYYLVDVEQVGPIKFTDDKERLMCPQISQIYQTPIVP